MKVFAIDPGIGGTGWAHLEGGSKARPRFSLVRAGNIYAPKSVKSWESRADHIADEMHVLLYRHLQSDFCEYVIEFPTYMPGKEVSSRSDSTVKMAYIVGRFAQMIQPHLGRHSNLTLLLPCQWKGTMSKELVERRCRKFIDFDVRAHAIDAIGIGLKHLGAW